MTGSPPSGPRPPPGSRRSPSGSTTTSSSVASAREAGATRVYAYRALFEQGERELGAWVKGLASTETGATAGREQR